MPRKLVDSARCVELAKQGLTSGQIAQVIGCCPPAVFRAFRKEGYITPAMKEGRKRRARKLMLPPAPSRYDIPPPAVNDIAPPPPRDPCLKCGVRADIGCKHRTARHLGWCVG